MQGERPWLSLHARAAPAELHPSHLSWQSTSFKVGKPLRLPTLNLVLPHTGSRTNPPRLRGQRQTQLHSFCAAIPPGISTRFPRQAAVLLPLCKRRNRSW